LRLFQFPAAANFSVDALLRGNRLISVLVLVPRPLLGDEPFDPRMPPCEDWNLWCRLGQQGAACVSLPRVLFGYRLHSASISRKVDALHAAGRRVLARWRPFAEQPQLHHDDRHRWAAGCGAIALASGDGNAIFRYLADLPPLELSDAFVRSVASGLHWAYLFVRGAQRQTWRRFAPVWLSEIETWLRGGPLAEQTSAILAALQPLTACPAARAAAVQDWLASRTAARRVVVYGLGTNGLALLEYLRDTTNATHGNAPTELELSVADDHADASVFEHLCLPREDPRRWKTWPSDTVVVVTPNDHAAISRRLTALGGRAHDRFLTLVDCQTPTATTVG
jgi:hypothetical protein